MADIHATAIIDSSAQLADGVVVGPYAVIGPRVQIGAGSEIRSFAHIYQDTILGENNRVNSYVALGSDPQIRNYVLEGRSELVIGSGNTFHEGVSISRGIAKFGGQTRIGDNNLFMLGAHIGHDSRVGSNSVFVNNSTTAGHVQIGNNVTLGANCAVHQFCRVGDYAFISHSAPVVLDILPYLMVVGNPARVRGLNRIGLKRHDFSLATRLAISSAYRAIFLQGNEVKLALEVLADSRLSVVEVERMCAFLESSERGVVR